ncbi:MAG TPA: PqqD family peptide modification chaperone [Candidatus Acidoferrales bacterium]|nr:PqqD family peptide modification chaperone [Candidatus Acidoferrales bacterium]
MKKSSTRGISIQLTRRGLRVNLTPRGIERLRRDFARDNFIVLPRLIEPALLRVIQHQIERARFTQRVHRGFGRDLQLRTAPAGASLALLLNDRELFSILERITGCGRVGSLIGSIRRATPGPGNSLGWHSDDLGHRKVAITINLGHKPYRGGRLQIRRRKSGRIVAEASNTVAGNAIVFRIAPTLEHRNTAVEGDTPKTAFSGWLVGKPDFERTFRRTLAARGKQAARNSPAPSHRIAFAPNAAVVLPAAVATHTVGADTVLLNFANGNYYGLDPVGAEIWHLISRGLSPRAASRAIARSYDAPAGQVERDILSLLAQLKREGLLDPA